MSHMHYTVLLMMLSPVGLDSMNHCFLMCVCVCAAMSSCRSRGKAIIWTWSKLTQCNTSPCWKWTKPRNTRPSRNQITTIRPLKDSSRVHDMTNIFFPVLFYHPWRCSSPNIEVIISLVAHPHVLTQNYCVASWDAAHSCSFFMYLIFCQF